MTMEVGQPERTRAQTLLDRYKPEPISGGAEHVVFRIPNHPTIVLKVEHNRLYQKLAAKDYAPYSDAERASLGQERNRRAKELARYFGSRALAQKVGVAHLPIPPHIRAQFLKQDPGVPEELDLVATVQMASRGIGQEEALSFTEPAAYPVEPQPDETKDAALAAWAFGSKALSPREAGVLLAKRFPGFSQKVWEIRDTSWGEQILQEFVQSAIRYSRETGEGMDLIGSNNVVFFRNQKARWEFECLDTLFKQPRLLSRVRHILEEAVADPSRTLSADELDEVVFAIQYVEMVNAVAVMAGTSERLFPWSDIPGAEACLTRLVRHATT
jgi:hypothetical protein